MPNPFHRPERGEVVYDDQGHAQGRVYQAHAINGTLHLIEFDTHNRDAWVERDKKTGQLTATHIMPNLDK